MMGGRRGWGREARVEGGREEREVETLCWRMGRKAGRSVRTTWAPRRARVMPTVEEKEEGGEEGREGGREGGRENEW
jgi:hypothetical protein